MEKEFIIGAKKDGQSVTLEPGGQFELSGAPLANLHQTCAEVHSHLYQVKTVCKELGVAFLGLGFQPKWSVEQDARDAQRPVPRDEGVHAHRRYERVGHDVPHVHDPG
jgi:glutamate--cysteine ligase